MLSGSIPVIRSKYSKIPKSLKLRDFLFLARRKGFEPLTFWSVARHSIQLS